MEDKTLTQINIDFKDKEKVEVNEGEGDIGNSTGVTDHQEIANKSEVVQKEETESKPASTQESQTQPAGSESITETTPVTAGNETVVVDSGYQTEGTVQNATVVESTPSAEIHEEAAEEAVTIDDVEDVVNSGTIELAP